MFPYLFTRIPPVSVDPTGIGVKRAVPYRGRPGGRARRRVRGRVLEHRDRRRSRPPTHLTTPGRTGPLSGWRPVHKSCSCCARSSPASPAGTDPRRVWPPPGQERWADGTAARRRLPCGSSRSGAPDGAVHCSAMAHRHVTHRRASGLCGRGSCVDVAPRGTSHARAPRRSGTRPVTLPGVAI